MTPKELFDYLQNGELDFEFEYQNKSGTICFCYLPKVYVLYDGLEVETSFPNLMDEPFLEGKSLREVAEKIEMYG